MNIVTFIIILERKTNVFPAKLKTPTSVPPIVNRKFGEPPTFFSTTFDKEELRKFSKLTLEEMFNSGGMVKKKVEEEDSIENFHANDAFRVDNRIKNEKPFYEFNTCDTIIASYIVLNAFERLQFRQDVQPIEYKFEQSKFNFTVDNAQVRVEQALDQVGFLDNLPMSKVSSYKFLYRDADIRIKDLAQILKWNPHQVAKFMMQNDFDEIYDEIVLNGIDGHKLCHMTIETAYKLTGGDERRTHQLLIFVNNLKQFFMR